MPQQTTGVLLLSNNEPQRVQSPSLLKTSNSQIYSATQTRINVYHRCSTHQLLQAWPWSRH